MTAKRGSFFSLILIVNYISKFHLIRITIVAIQRHVTAAIRWQQTVRLSYLFEIEREFMLNDVLKIKNAVFWLTNFAEENVCDPNATNYVMRHACPATEYFLTPTELSIYSIYGQRLENVSHQF